MLSETLVPLQKRTPLCPVFGACGGCAYQDLPYEEELRIKEHDLKFVLRKKLDLEGSVFEEIVPSPVSYHSRSRLDLSLLRIKTGETFLGFMPAVGKRVIPIDACAIARKEISRFIPRLKCEAAGKLPPHYRTANLVIKTGDDGRVLWGGIGRHSLRLHEKDYLWTLVRDRKIFYSLDTFFQANLSILPRMIDEIEKWLALTSRTIFLDLYSGVGLFGIALADKVKEVHMVEESGASTQMAHFNVGYHGLRHLHIHEGKVEEVLPPLLEKLSSSDLVGIVDPPRRGLAPGAVEVLQNTGPWRSLLYLSCHPESLSRDLAALAAHGWGIRKVIPFDFFPKTRHLETLVWMEP